MIKLTKTSVTKFKACDKDQFIWEESLPGFGVRAKSSGRKTYILQYRNKYGRSRRMTLSNAASITLDQARKMAREYLSEISEGEAPLTNNQSLKSSPTIEQTIERFFTDHCAPRCNESTEALIQMAGEEIHHSKPRLLKVQEDSRSTIETFHKSLGCG